MSSTSTSSFLKWSLQVLLSVVPSSILPQHRRLIFEPPMTVTHALKETRSFPASFTSWGEGPLSEEEARLFLRHSPQWTQSLLKPVSHHSTHVSSPVKDRPQSLFLYLRVVLLATSTPKYFVFCLSRHIFRNGICYLSTFPSSIMCLVTSFAPNNNWLQSIIQKYHICNITQVYSSNNTLKHTMNTIFFLL